MFKAKIISGLFLVLILVIIEACSNEVTYSSEVEMPDGIWKSKVAAVFNPSFTDSSQYYNIRLSVSNTNQYKYSNLWLFIKTKSPDGFYQKDTLEVLLAQTDGKWVGEKEGDNWNLNFYFQKKIRFPGTGSYSFEIHQGMREIELSGINKLTFEIEKYNE